VANTPPALSRDSTFHERLAQLVVSPFYHALAYVASYHGWTSQRFEELNRNIIRLLPGVFVAGPSPDCSTVSEHCGIVSLVTGWSEPTEALSRAPRTIIGT
jgi:hypothetical protein